MKNYSFLFNIFWVVLLRWKKVKFDSKLNLIYFNIFIHSLCTNNDDNDYCNKWEYQWIIKEVFFSFFLFFISWWYRCDVINRQFNNQSWIVIFFYSFDLAFSFFFIDDVINNSSITFSFCSFDYKHLIINKINDKINEI